jgi:type I restriction enzyme S subunit
MISLLKERKQIIIQDLVTGKKVWNPEKNTWTKPAKVKESGVEWIGEIPEGWEVKSLKYIANLESGSTISSESFVEEGYPVYGGNGFRGYSNTYTNEGKHALIGRQGALCGNVNYADGKFFASEHAIVAYHNKDINVIWLGEAIKVADFNRLSQSAAQPGIAVNVIKNVLFPFPKPDQQNRIASHIEAQSAKIAKAISLQQQQIEKLKELKSTLIDGAVTGKIMVASVK